MNAAIHSGTPWQSEAVIGRRSVQLIVENREVGENILQLCI